MAKNDLVLLDSIIEERVAIKLPSEKKDEVFEYLAYEQVLKEYDLSLEEIKAGSVDGRNDGGIDAIFIIVNGHLISDVKNAIFPKSNANLEVYFFTCKHKDSFRQEPINSIFTSLQELLDFSKNNSDMDGEYNEDVLEKRDVFINTYKKVAAIMDSFTIKVIFASRGDVKSELAENVEARGKQIENLCKEYFSGCDAQFEFWGSEELLTAYRKKADYSLELDVEECLTHGKQMVVLATLRNYYDFITYEDKKIRKYLFDSNVRDFMGLNSVNGDILESLRQPKENEDFWWLNNGITILCSSAVAVGKNISITNVQIVNGLQTSECIYRYFSEQDGKEEKRVVLIKILPCDNSAIADDIIRSTNNQTAVQSASLRATDKIQEDIEEVLQKRGLYYERRINYHANQGVPRDKIYSPLYLAAGYMALVLKRPYNAVSLKQKFMRKEGLYREIFSEDENLLVWPQIAIIMRNTDNYMVQLRDNNAGEKFLRNVRYLVALLTVSRIMGTFTYSTEALVKFDLSKYTFEEVKKTWKDIQTTTVVGERLSGWRSRNLSLEIMDEVAAMEGIKNFKAIDKRTLRPADLTEEYLLQVKECLPKQPWPKNVRIEVAKKLGISNKVANIAIGELLKRKMI